MRIDCEGVMSLINNLRKQIPEAQKFLFKIRASVIFHYCQSLFQSSVCVCLQSIQAVMRAFVDHTDSLLEQNDHVVVNIEADVAVGLILHRETATKDDQAVPSLSKLVIELGLHVLGNV